MIYIVMESGANFYSKFLVYLPRIPVALVVCGIGWFLGNLWNRFYSRVSKKSTIDPLARKYIGRLVYITIFSLALIIALSVLGLNISPFLASIGAGGLIIGFGVRETVSDFASGLLIFMYRPFKIGDFIKIGVVEGEIKAISPVNIEIEGKDGKKIIMPNRSAWGQVVYNSTKEGKNIITLQITVAISSNNLDQILARLFSNMKLTYKCVIASVSTSEIIYTIYLEIPKEESRNLDPLIRNVWQTLNQQNITAAITVQR